VLRVEEEEAIDIKAIVYRICLHNIPHAKHSTSLCWAGKLANLNARTVVALVSMFLAMQQCLVVFAGTPRLHTQIHHSSHDLLKVQEMHDGENTVQDQVSDYPAIAYS
jgi:hypothetical protein